MRIFMHWDMEGVSGSFTREHVWYWEEGAREHIAEQGRQLLIDDINSAAAAALEAGVDELIVCDTHHGGGNIILDRMLSDPRITYLDKSRGYQNGKLRWMPGLDESVDGFMVPGHHAKAGTQGAFLPHTWTLEWADFRINGQSVGEMGIEACFAGYWDIPVVMMQGDQAACAEAEEQFPGIVTAPVKRATSHDLCVGPDAESARRLTARKVAEAIEKLRAGLCAPYKAMLPMTVTIVMRSAEAAEAAAAKPQVQRIDE
ncbi:MAG: M55 family metallopeptidase, partial [Candidatus Brocadiae bacterium]|nr:M55 family metallopeptidase [Candidatus Brocadiia bacterium]